MVMMEMEWVIFIEREIMSHSLAQSEIQEIKIFYQELLLPKNLKN